MNDDRSLHVAVYTDSKGIGGAEISLGHLVATAAKDIAITVIGVSQTVVEAISAKRNSEGTAARRPHADQIVLPDSGVASVIAHLATLHRLRPDIVHINLCTPWAGAIGLAAALTLPQARVVRVDQLPLRTTDAVELWRTRLLSLRVDAHVAVGEGSARLMEDFYALGRHSVLSVPNGVPDRAPTPLPERASGQLFVGSIGRLDAMKAHDILLRAIAQVDGVTCAILGEGEQRVALEQLADELGIRDRVELRGWVENPRDYLGEFDAIVQPSRSEGFPLAIVEAMLAARPVVATRVGSVAEAVLHEETGILIDKNNVEQLATALRRLRDQPKLRQRLASRGREVAVAHFTAAQMTVRYEQLWQSLMTTPQVPRLRVPRPRD